MGTKLRRERIGNPSLAQRAQTGEEKLKTPGASEILRGTMSEQRRLLGAEEWSSWEQEKKVHLNCWEQVLLHSHTVKQLLKKTNFIEV